MMLILLEIGQNYLILLTKNNIQNTNINRLSVQVGLTGLSFLITNTATSEIVFFYNKNYDLINTPEELLVKIQNVINQQKLIFNQFKEVVIIYATNLYALVPTLLFDKHKASEYLKFNSKILPGDFIATDETNNKEITVAYVPYTNINNYFYEQFGDLTFYHSSIPLLNHFLTIENNSTTTKVYVHILTNYYDLIIFKDGKLLLFNTYHFITSEDFIYYILFSFEQLNLNPDKVEVQFCGEVKKEDAIFEISYKYIRNISIYSKNESISSSNTKETNSTFLLNLSL